MNNKYDLEECLITFAIEVIDISEIIEKTFAGKNLANQISRSGTSPALNYGEALAAESKKDFIHKIKLVLKELRETSICLKIINRKPLVKDDSKLIKSIKECNELIAIFVTSVRTAKNKM